MKYLLLNKQIFQVEDTYSQEASDSTNLVELYPLNSDTSVGNMQAGILKQISFELPEYFKEVIQKRVYAAALKEYNSIDIRMVLRLLVNNSGYIHYLIGPVLKEDLINREGGQYFTFVDVDGVPTLFGGETAKDLYSCIDAGISAENNKQLITLHDNYLVTALDKLLHFHNGTQTEINPLLLSAIKDPQTFIPPIGGQEATHGPHCKICQTYGLNGLHGWMAPDVVYGSTPYHGFFKVLIN